MKAKESIKHLATEVKKICDKYNIPTSIDLEKYKGEENSECERNEI